MIHLTHTIAGQECDIFVPERRAELAGFDEFLRRNDPVLGLDTETTGLNIYSPGYECRLVQIGNETEAWVLRVDLFADVIRTALRPNSFGVGRLFAVHNAAFDLQVLDQCLGIRIEELADRVFDTRIFAHLIDPRDEGAGGAGLSLKPLSAIYVDPEAPDTQEGLKDKFSALFAAWKKVTPKDVVDEFVRKAGKRPFIPFGFANVDIMDELYLRYAGLDVILETRLFKELASIIKNIGLNHLSKFEHLLQSYLVIMQRRGMLVDVAYTQDELIPELSAQAAQYRKVAARYGVENVNSTKQVSEALLAMGETLTERTDSGALKVDKAVLSVLADLDREWELIGARKPNPLADAVMRTKRAKDWGDKYAQAFLDLRDSGDRLHASVGGLAARTARMSVSRPPLQQLPSSDWRVRRSIIADPGMRMMSADYDQIELRVLAALADVKAMKQAIADGVDLHDYTASLVYGASFSKFQRKLMKGVGFGKVYGGGKETLSRQTGADIDAVAHAIAEYDRVYPEIKAFGRKLQRRAEYGKREVITVSGRHLPLDKDRLYSATNYVVQSTARDILAQAIVDMFDAGLGDYLLLPIHDEILAQAPERELDEVAREIGRIMTGDFRGVPLTATADVTGRNWGAAYGADPDAASWALAA